MWSCFQFDLQIKWVEYSGLSVGLQEPARSPDRLGYAWVGLLLYYTVNDVKYLRKKIK